ncbi:putative protein kinase RLK-Pelle-SD-2b family [Helianthus annuus]|nr:putative protein kinase RLK-Pelle-SD-2b family [Helianthus annuus]
MNLIEIWGYCVEGKHRLLVYEYMENGSLSQNLQSNKLDWDKRLDIALAIEKGLAYVHEECLEWILHCDVKPHNILLDRDYKPKVADFRLSKLLDINRTRDLEFTRARGTREMIIGASQCGGSEGRLDSWVREKIIVADGKNDWIREVVDSAVDGNYNMSTMGALIKVALRCCEEDKDAKPTMSQVVDMLLHVEEDD